MEEELNSLLTSWGMKPQVIQHFLESDIDMFALEHMTEESIRRLIQTEGQQIRFSAQRTSWLKEKEKQRVQADTASTLLALVNPDGAVVDANGNQLSMAESIPDILMEEDDPCLPDATETTHECNEPAPRPAKKQKTYDLSSLLKGSLDGQKILARYSSTKELDEENRNKMSACVIANELKEDVSTLLSYDHLAHIADAIIELFPTESKDTYISRSTVRGKSIIKGKLHTRYYNQRRGLRGSGLLNKTLTRNHTEKSETVVVTPDIEGHILWLTNNAKDKDIPEIWKKTSKARLQMLMDKENEKKPLYEYTSKFPALLEPDGYRLLELDFLDQYQDKRMALFEAWPRLAAYVTKVIREKDADFLKDSVYSPGEKILRVLSNMSSLFKTVTISRGKRKKGTKQWRPSQVDAQEAFLLQIDHISLLHEKLDTKRQKLATLGLHMQPQPVIVGTIENPTQCLVVVDHFHYEVDTPLTAIDVAFKCYFALFCGYPPEAEQLWFFLQRAVYDITTPHDGLLTNVLTRVAEFKRFSL